MRSIAGLFNALVIRQMAQHKARVLLTVTSVAIGVAVVVAIAIANRTSIDSFQSTVDFVSGGATIEAVAPGTGFPDEAVVRAREVRGVAAASPVVAGFVTDPTTADVYDLDGVDFLAATQNGTGNAGPSFPADKARFTRQIFERGAIIVSASLARSLHAGLGDDVPMIVGDRTVTFTVAGVVEDDAMPIGARGAIFCDLSTAQDALQRVGQIDRIEVIPKKGVNADKLQTRLAAVLPSGSTFSTPSQRGAALAKLTDAFRYSLGALAAIALLVGGFLVFNAVSMSVVQRRGEIGVARAIGASRAAIFAIFLIEGAVVGGAGSAFGIVLGRLLAAVTLRELAGTVNMIYDVTNPFGISAPAGTYWLALLVGVGLAVAASILPALEAASVAPSVAMRAGSWERAPSAPTSGFAAAAVAAFAAAYGFTLLPPVSGRPVFGYTAAVFVLAGCSLLAPPLVAAAATAARVLLPSGISAALRLAPANLRGRVRRNAVAVASLMIGVAMTVSVSTMIDSLRDSVQSWISTTFRGDIFVRPFGAVTSDLMTMPTAEAGRVKRVAGIAAVDIVRSREIQIGDSPTFAASSDMSVTALYGYLPLLDGGDWKTVGRSLVGSDLALASEPFARKFGVKRGDLVVVQSIRGPVTLRIAGVFQDFSNDAGHLFLDDRTYVRLFGDDGIKGMAVYAKPGTDIARLRGGIERALPGQRLDLRTNGELRTLGLAQFDRTFAVTSVLDAIAVIVAMMGIVATLSALVLERRRELGLLRCLGMTRSQVRSMIVFEALLLGVLGGLLGVGAGYALAGILVFVIDPQAFGWTIGFQANPLYDAIIFAGVALTAACAGLIPAAAAARLDVAQSLRTE